MARANSFARGVSIDQTRSSEHRQTSLAVPPGKRKALRGDTYPGAGGAATEGPRRRLIARTGGAGLP